MACVRGRRFLDVCCGTGRWLTWARERGAAACGVDFSPEMLAQAAGRPGLRGRLAAADCRMLPVADCSADVVLCALALGHLGAFEDAIAQLARVAAAGASVILTDLHPEAYRKGWRRTFRSGGQLYAIENHYHRPDAVLAAARRHGLRLVAKVEPCFGEPERHFFVEAGKPALFDEVRETPALLICRWEKEVL
jgi:malonyl-CoA O-methyltransferase